MGYAFVIGRCVSCRRQFTFNPVKVPSVRVKGVRQPVCSQCMAVFNAERVRQGLPPVEIRPEAYEACHEAELG